MNWLEITGFICGVAGVFLTMRENIFAFPVGLVNVIVSLFLFYEQKLYADTLQQAVYIILLSYGWIKWIAGNKNDDLHISKTSFRLAIILFFTWISTSLLLGFLLHNYTDASFPWIDSSATAACFIAQWMIAKKKIENWIIWIVVNVTYILIYINKNLFLYSLLYAVYLGLAIWALYEWKTKLLKQKNV